MSKSPKDCWCTDCHKYFSVDELFNKYETYSNGKKRSQLTLTKCEECMKKHLGVDAIKYYIFVPSAFPEYVHGTATFKSEINLSEYLMYQSISGVPGMIGILQTHGNGFYTPSNEKLLTYIKPDMNCIVDLQQITFPFEFVLIGYQSSEHTCYKMFVTAKNPDQVRYLYRNLSAYCGIIPKSCVNEEGLRLQTDPSIMDYYKSKEFDEITM